MSIIGPQTYNAGLSAVSLRLDKRNLLVRVARFKVESGANWWHIDIGIAVIKL